MNATAWFEEIKSAEGLARLCAQQAPRWISGLLLAGLAVQVALLLTSDPAANTEPVLQPTPATSAPTAPNRTLELATILNAHLFGLAAASAASVSDAPQTSMPLVLAGVLAMPDPQQGMAIVGPNAGAARLYTIGAQLPGGVKLHSVYSDRVLLDRNGSVEALFLPKTLSSTTSLQPAPAAAATPGQRLQTLAQGNQLIGGVLRLQPVLNQGKLAGYRLFPGARGSTAVFAELGLQSGDLITAVNGTPLDDADRAQEIVQTLSSASSATVTVTRNGQPLEVNLNLETVAARAEAAAAEAAAAPSDSGARGSPPGGGPGPGFGGRFRGGRGGGTNSGANSGTERAAAER